MSDRFPDPQAYDSDDTASVPSVGSDVEAAGHASGGYSSDSASSSSASLSDSGSVASASSGYASASGAVTLSSLREEQEETTPRASSRLPRQRSASTSVRTRRAPRAEEPTASARIRRAPEKQPASAPASKEEDDIAAEAKLGESLGRLLERLEIKASGRTAISAPTRASAPRTNAAGRFAAAR